MVDADRKGDVIQTGTGSPNGENDSDKNENGIAFGHAYSVIGVKELQNGTRLVKVRNPWGKEGFNGKWSDKSDAWTNETRAEVNLVNEDDGVFFIEFKDYLNDFLDTIISFDNSDWSHAAFIKLGDDSQDRPKHTLTVSSDTDQLVWIAGNTWDPRGQSPSCHGDGSHRLEGPNGSTATW